MEFGSSMTEKGSSVGKIRRFAVLMSCHWKRPSKNETEIVPQPFLMRELPAPAPPHPAPTSNPQITPINAEKNLCHLRNLRMLNKQGRGQRHPAPTSNPQIAPINAEKNLCHLRNLRMS
jgi:hypothetical protein